MEQDKCRVIKISADALYEFIYETFIANQEEYLDVNALEVSDAFAVDWKNGKFIFCAYKSEDDEGNFITLPKEIDLDKLLQSLPDTTDTILADNRYVEYSKDELIKYSK